MGNGLEQYTTEALESRLKELDEHEWAMASDPAYTLDVLYHVIPDPLHMLDPDDPWGSWSALEDELARRELEGVA